jgi:hypothetical protein
MPFKNSFSNLLNRFNCTYGTVWTLTLIIFPFPPLGLSYECLLFLHLIPLVGTGSENNGHVSGSSSSRDRESHPMRELPAIKSGRRSQQQPYPTFKVHISTGCFQWSQCCGSGMFPGSDFYPSRIRTFSIADPGSASKNLSILTPKKPKKWFLSSRKYDPSCSSRIPDPDADFLPIPDPGSRGQKGTGSRIRIRNTEWS